MTTYYRFERRRRLHEPEVVAEGSDSDEAMPEPKREMDEESEEEEDLDEEVHIQ